VDFSCTLPLAEVARAIGDACFGGAAFGGENSGIWDEVPAVKLDRAILGFEVIVGGGPLDGYTLTVEALEPAAPLPSETAASASAICDFSRYLASLLAGIAPFDGVRWGGGVEPAC
jgi:hypothetical protein